VSVGFGERAQACGGGGGGGLGSFGRGLSILFGSMGMVANAALSLQKGEKCRVCEEKNLLFFSVTSTT